MLRKVREVCTLNIDDFPNYQARGKPRHERKDAKPQPESKALRLANVGMESSRPTKRATRNAELAI